MPTSASSTRSRTGPVLAVVSLALMTVVSAVSGLNVALPDLARETGASQTQMTWIVDAYTVVFAGLLLFAGALGDRFGRRGLLVAGLVVFGLAAGARHADQRPDPADRAACPHGRRRRRDHAHHAVGDHHLVPGGGAAQGHRGLGRRGRRRSRPRPVRQRHPAGVLLVELVLRVERGPGGGCAWSGRCSSCPGRSTRTRRGSTWWAPCCRWSPSSALVFAIIEGPDRGWGDALTLTGLVVGVRRAGRVRRGGSCRGPADARPPPVPELRGFSAGHA